MQKHIKMNRESLGVHNTFLQYLSQIILTTQENKSHTY